MAHVKLEWEESEEEWTETLSVHRRKRRKTNKASSYVEASAPTGSVSLSPLLDVLNEGRDPRNDDYPIIESFESVVEDQLSELRKAESSVRDNLAEADPSGYTIRPLSCGIARQVLDELENDSTNESPPAYVSAILAQRLKMQPGFLRRLILDKPSIHATASSVTPLSMPRTSQAVNPQVLDALYAIQTTPYKCSFLSRLRGYQPPRTSNPIAVDWETRSPWMDLMSDVRDHYYLCHPEREQPDEAIAPIEYVTIHPSHLGQIHELLSRTFWEGINVGDALQRLPEKCTVVAVYKKLVVGVALLSSPQETYITYLAVRTGWENSHIATSMLYHLITLNPNRDITLHVSINNPAMLLYNRFGFKAEEFVVGFYEDYLDPQSRASKNAFRLRLRR